MGGHSLHEAGIHSPSCGAPALRARTTPPDHEPHLQPLQPTIVIPAAVALGGHSLHRAGIHSPGLGASRIRARTTPPENEPHPHNRNHHRHPRRSRYGRTPTPQSGDPFTGTRRVMPPAPDYTNRRRTTPPAPAADHRHPRRSRVGRTPTPQSGDLFARTPRVAPADPLGRVARELLAVNARLVPRVKPEDDDDRWVGRC